MCALSIRGFVLISALGAVVLGGAIAGLSLAFGRLPSEAILFSLGGFPLGIMVAGIWYLVDVARDLRALHLKEEDLQEGEVVELETPHSIVHHRSGSPRRAWEAAGGKLVLTNQRLVFLAHRGQPYHYRLSLPLSEITQADDSAPSIAGVPGGLRVTLNDGRSELFGFGVLWALETEEWVADILDAKIGA